jgi:hypothetical protein
MMNQLVNGWRYAAILEGDWAQALAETEVQRGEWTIVSRPTEFRVFCKLMRSMRRAIQWEIAAEEEHRVWQDEESRRRAEARTEQFMLEVAMRVRWYETAYPAWSRWNCIDRTALDLKTSFEIVAETLRAASRRWNDPDLAA